MKKKLTISWIFQLIAAAILLQAFYGKISSDPTAVFIFSTLEMEPFGRFLIGGIEFMAGLFLLFPKLSATGALLGTGTMLGAILGHLTQLGIEVQGDGGQLFMMALISLACNATVLYINRKQIPFLGTTL